MPKYFTAIIVNEIPGMPLQFIKYRNIPESKLEKLKKYVAKAFPLVHHVNLYRKENRQFYEQIKRKDIFP